MSNYICGSVQISSEILRFTQNDSRHWLVAKIRSLPALAGTAIVALTGIITHPPERRRHIYLCRDLKISVRELWPRVKNWL